MVVATLVAGLLTEWFTGIPSRVPAQLAALAGWRAGDRAAEIAAAVEDDQPREPMSRAVQVEQVVERLLTSYYGNDVPSAEQRRWRDVAGQGPIDLTVIEFMGSTDTIKDHYASGSPDWFVKEAYDVMLGRQPDYYAHGSVSLAKTWEGRLGVISAIASSPEFLERRGG